jgi:uncharacterized membrane protein YGL010W
MRPPAEDDAMRRVDALLTDYGSHHRTRGNLVCHAFGITLIVFGILSMLGRIGAAEWLIAAAFVFYLALDVPLALAILVPLAALDLLARAVSDWRIGLAAFAAGWVFQAVGHARFERNRPAFFRNLVHLMIGPIYLVNEVVKARRVPADARGTHP